MNLPKWTRTLTWFTLFLYAASFPFYYFFFSIGAQLWCESFNASSNTPREWYERVPRKALMDARNPSELVPVECYRKVIAKSLTECIESISKTTTIWQHTIFTCTVFWVIETYIRTYLYYRVFVVDGPHTLDISNRLRDDSTPIGWDAVLADKRIRLGVWALYTGLCSLFTGYLFYVFNPVVRIMLECLVMLLVSVVFIIVELFLQLSMRHLYTPLPE